MQFDKALRQVQSSGGRYFLLLRTLYNIRTIYTLRKENISKNNNLRQFRNVRIFPPNVRIFYFSEHYTQNPKYRVNARHSTMPRYTYLTKYSICGILGLCPTAGGCPCATCAKPLQRHSDTWSFCLFFYFGGSYDYQHNHSRRPAYH